MIADDRGVSTPISHAFALAVTSVLLIIFLSSAGTFVEDTRERVAGDSVDAIGNRVTAEVASLNRLVEETGTGTQSDPVAITVSVPEQVVGSDYTIRKQTGEECRELSSPCLEVDLDGLDVTEQYPLVLGPDTELRIRSKGGGEYRVTAWSTATVSADGPDIDPTTRVGVGAGYQAEPGGVAGGFNRPPRAAFEWTPTEPTSAPGTVLDASGSDDPDGDIVAYRWDPDNDGIYEARGRTASVELDPGTNDVTLQVVDEGGKFSTKTKLVNTSGVVYTGDMDVGASDDSVAVEFRNEWPSQVDLDQFHIDVDDPAVDGLDSPGDEFDSVGTSREFAWTGFPDDGRFLPFDAGATLDSGDAGDATVRGFRSGGGSADMHGRRVTVDVRYEIYGKSNVSSFTDTVGDPEVRNYRVVRTADGVEARFEATSLADAASAGSRLAVERLRPDGTTVSTFEISTLSSTSPYLDCSGPGPEGFRDCVAEVAGPSGSRPLREGEYVVTLTDVESDDGVNSDQLPLEGSVAAFGGDYGWDSGADWDGVASRRGVVHDDVGDFDAGTLRLGTPAVDQGGSALVGYWPFEGESGAVEDATSNDNDGFVGGSGTVTRGLPGLGESRTVHTDASGFVEFNGGGVSSLSGGDDATVSAGVWFKPTAPIPSGTGTLFGKREFTGGSPQSDWSLVVRQSCPSGGSWHPETTCVGSGPYVGYYSAASGTRYGVFYGPVKVDRWQHVAFAMDGPDDTLTLHVDGSPVVSATMPDGLSASTTDEARAGDSFAGKIENARLYSRVLTDDQVEQELYGSATEGTLVTDTRTGTPLEQTDLVLQYGAELEPGETATVTVVSPDGQSEPIKLTDGVHSADVVGLPSGTADEYHLEVELSSASPANTPEVNALKLEEV